MQLISKEIESYGLSDIGLSRSNNEDVWAEIPEIYFYTLADGMGGHQAGEVAAKEAVMELCDVVDDLFTITAKPSSHTLLETLKKGFRESNRWVRSLATQHPELNGMGTTLCCFCVYEKDLYYAHVGDSRIYQYRERLTQLSEDHSLRQALLSSGELDAEAAANFRYKNIITRAIGTAPKVEASIGITKVQMGDIYFLCSDGLSDFVSCKQIESILSKSSSIKEASLELVEAAKNGNSNDNISIVMIKIVSI
jgi:serine/threonine protein phosphatase PrpC